MTQDVVSFPHRIKELGLRLQRFLSSHQSTGYFFGGVIRNSLLKRPLNDLDILLCPSESSLFASLGAKWNEIVGPEYEAARLTQNDEFGVLQVYLRENHSPNSNLLELYLPRTGLTWSSSRPSVGSTGDITPTLSLSNFSINAVAVSLDARQLVDPYHGISDAHAGIVRSTTDQLFILEPHTLLRAVTLCVTYSLQLAESTAVQFKEAITRKSLLEVPPIELYQRMKKIFSAESFLSVLIELEHCGLLSQIFPNLSVAPTQLSPAAFQHLQKLPTLGDEGLGPYRIGLFSLFQGPDYLNQLIESFTLSPLEAKHLRQLQILTQKYCDSHIEE